MPDLTKLYDAILNGDNKTAVAVTKEALAEGVAPMELITNYMSPPMDEVGRHFEREEYFVPELLLSGCAMKGALQQLQPLLAASGAGEGNRSRRVGGECKCCRYSRAPANSMSRTSIAIDDAATLVFGMAPHPVKCGFELTIGGGEVYPEVNFTLPPLTISEHTWPTVLAHYRTIVSEVLRRASALQVPGIILEFELLPAMTERPERAGKVYANLLHHSGWSFPAAVKGGAVPAAFGYWKGIWHSLLKIDQR